MTVTLAQHIEANSMPEPNSGCWLWMRFVDKKGYGKLGLKKWGEQMAHRAAYVAAHGSIPKGMCVCHKCDNPGCVNPDHLFAGSVQDNSDDKWKKGRANIPFGSRHAQTKNTGLTEEKIAQIRADSRSGYALAAEYGVSRTTISLIKRGLAWRHVA
jgi:hypothetical protein